MWKSSVLESTEEINIEKNKIVQIKLRVWTEKYQKRASISPQQRESVILATEASIRSKRKRLRWIQRTPAGVWISQEKRDIIPSRSHEIEDQRRRVQAIWDRGAQKDRKALAGSNWHLTYQNQPYWEVDGDPTESNERKIWLIKK